MRSKQLGNKKRKTQTQFPSQVNLWFAGTASQWISPGVHPCLCYRKTDDTASSPCEYEIGELRNAQLIHCTVLAPFQGFLILISTTKKEETFNIRKESSLIHSVTHTHVVSQTGSRFVDLQALLFCWHSCRRLWLFFTVRFCFDSVLCFFCPKDLDGCLNYNNNTFKSRRHVNCTIDFEPWDYCYHDGSSHGTFQICSGLSGDVRWRWEVLSNLPYFDSTINIGIQRYQRGCHVSNTWQGPMEPMMPWPHCQSSFRPGFTEFCQWVRSMKYDMNGCLCSWWCNQGKAREGHVECYALIWYV